MFNKVFQFHELSELCSALCFSGVRNFNFRYFGTFGTLSFGTQDFGFSELPSSRHFGTSSFGVSAHEAFRPALFSKPRLPKFRLTLPYGSTAQLSPTTTVARGKFMRVHVAFNDVIGSHLSRFSSRPHWHVVQLHVSMFIPRKIRRSDLPQIYGADPFEVLGFQTPMRSNSH
jgi:hypothetical protein